MSKKIAVEFNDHSIKFMEGSRKGKMLRVYKNGQFDLPDGVLSDGMIRNLDEVLDVLKNFIGNSVKHKKAKFLINSNSVFIRKFELPYVKNIKETSSMINFKLQELLPSCNYQYKIMFKTSEIFMSEGVKKAIYIVYGMPLKMYESYIELSEKIKLDLAAMDIASNFTEYILNVNTSSNSVEKEVAAVINAGKSSIDLSIINKGITELFRTAEYDCHDNMFKSIDEISKYMKYYTSANDNVIGKIYLLGECDDDEVKDKFSDFDMEAKIIEEMPYIYKEGLEASDEFLGYFNLAASFYAGKNHVDFLTEKKERQKYRFAAGVVVMTVVLTAALVLSYNFLNYYFKTSILENEAYSKEVFLSDSENILLNNEIENIKKRTAFLENYLIMASEAKEKSRQDDMISSLMFTKIKGCAASDTKISSFFTDVNNVEINCESSSLKSVALFVENLRNIEFVDNVSMTNVAVKKEEEESKYTYIVTCYLKGVDYEEQ